MVKRPAATLATALAEKRLSAAALAYETSMTPRAVLPAAESCLWSTDAKASGAPASAHVTVSPAIAHSGCDSSSETTEARTLWVIWQIIVLGVIAQLGFRQQTTKTH
jgi:hypothetical protein